MDFGQFKDLLGYIFAALLATGGFIMKKHMNKVDDLDREIRETKTDVMILKSKLDDMKDDIKEIKTGVAKLIEKR
jgi:hypothetical protein